MRKIIVNILTALFIWLFVAIHYFTILGLWPDLKVFCDKGLENRVFLLTAAFLFSGATTNLIAKFFP